MKKWINNLSQKINKNKWAKLIVAILIEVLKLMSKSFVVWITGLLLINYLANLPFINYWQCIAVTQWFRIMFYNLKNPTT